MVIVERVDGVLVVLLLGITSSTLPLIPTAPTAAPTSTAGITSVVLLAPDILLLVS